MSDGFVMTWGSFMALLSVLVAAGPAFFLIGKLWTIAHRNERDISSVFKKLEEIHGYIRRVNGHGGE